MIFESDIQGYVFKLIDFDKLYQESNALLINNIPPENFHENLIKAIMDKTNEKSMIASCECGKYTGNFYYGIVCDTCKTMVTDVKYPVDVFVRIPFNYKVLHPRLYLIFKRKSYFKTVIDFIINRFKPITNQQVLEFFQFAGLNKDCRGLKFFYENFDYIFDKLVEFYQLKKGYLEEKLDKDIEIEDLNKQERKKSNFAIKRSIFDPVKDLNALVNLVKNNNCFVSYLPVISSLHSITYYGRNQIIIDPTIKNLFKALTEFVFLEKRPRVREDKIERTILNAYEAYIKYINVMLTEKFKDKKGLNRKHIYGSNYHFSFRCVVTPILDPHDPDEIHIPWKIAVILFKFHLIGILRKRFGYKTIEAIKKVNKALTQIDAEINKCFRIMIEESPFKGIPVILNRNPTIRTGSLVLMFITKILMHSEAMAVPEFIIPWLNMDFDGDCANNFLIFENANIVFGYSDIEPFIRNNIIKPGNEDYFTDILIEHPNKGFMCLHVFNQLIGFDKFEVNTEHLPKYMFCHVNNFLYEE